MEAISASPISTKAQENLLSSIHHAVAKGYATKADKYVYGRPDYPAGIDTWLRLHLDLGLGKFTPLLVATGARMIAIEPVPQMLAKLSEAYP